MISLTVGKGTSSETFDTLYSGGLITAHFLAEDEKKTSALQIISVEQNVSIACMLYFGKVHLKGSLKA